jgi:hypothetical protein
MDGDKRAGEATSIAAGLAVGLGVAAVLGLLGVVVYLLARRRGDDALTGPAYVPYPVPAGPWGAPMLPVPSAPAPSIAALQGQFQQLRAPQMNGEPSPETRMKSWTLPATGEPYQIVKASRRPYRVVVRTVGPPGAFAIVSPDPTELVTNTNAVPVGDTLIIPSGAQNEIRLTPRQALYARGNVAGVCISVTYTELTDGA